MIKLFQNLLLEKKKNILSSQPKTHFVSFWDFDGTIIDGDISEGKKTDHRHGRYHGMVHRSIFSGLIDTYASGEKGIADFFRDYRGDLESYYYLGGLYSNLSFERKSQIQQLTRDTYEEVKKHFFDFSLDFLMFLFKEDIESYIISASPHIFVEEACEHLPVKREHIFGINLDEKDGKKVDPIFNYREGKRERALNILQTHPHAFPILAVGNDWTADGSMIKLVCEKGGFGILINGLHDDNSYQHPNFYRIVVQ